MICGTFLDVKWVLTAKERRIDGALVEVGWHNLSSQSLKDFIKRVSAFRARRIPFLCYINI
jgi:hypothetical protein